MNFPATYFFGGTTDGNANAICSETMAQKIRHATVYEAANHSTAPGLGADLAFDLAQDARATMSGVRRFYDRYVTAGHASAGKPFATWNDPATASDGTLPTSTTVAHEFVANVERNGNGYRAPVKRLTAFLGRCNADWLASYAARSNTPEADTFRSTLMVASVSHGVGKDLRPDFRAVPLSFIPGSLFARPSLTRNPAKRTILD